MTFDQILAVFQAFVSTITAIVLVATLIFVGIQAQATRNQVAFIQQQVEDTHNQVALIQQQTNIIKNSAEATLSTNFVGYFKDINDSLVNKPHIDKAFNKKTKYYNTLSRKKREIYNFLGLVISLYEPLYLYFLEGQLRSEEWPAWERWLVERVLNMDLFNLFWENESQFFEKAFTDYINSKIKSQAKNKTKKGVFYRIKHLIGPSRST